MSSSSFFSTTLNLLKLMLKLKTPPASNRECAKVRIKTNQSICFSIDFKYFFKKLKSFTWIIYVGLIVTGGNEIDRRKNVEVFPEKLDCPPPPQLPDPGDSHLHRFLASLSFGNGHEEEKWVRDLD